GFAEGTGDRGRVAVAIIGRGEEGEHGTGAGDLPQVVVVPKGGDAIVWVFRTGHHVAGPEVGGRVAGAVLAADHVADPAKTPGEVIAHGIGLRSHLLEDVVRVAVHAGVRM